MPNQKSDDRNAQRGNTGGNPGSQGQKSEQESQPGSRGDDTGSRGQQPGSGSGNQQGGGHMPNRNAEQGQHEKVSSDRGNSSWNEETEKEDSNDDEQSGRSMSEGGGE